MSAPSQKEMARYGHSIGGCRVKPDVFAALLSEAKRCKRSVGHIAATVMEYWYLDDYLPAQKKK